MSKQKTAGEVLAGVRTIVTHPGIFHADDVLAVAWLRMLDCNAPVQRRVPTPEELNDPCVLVADIGGVYDPETLCFDHHQKGGAGERWDSNVPYAGFGLVVDAFRHVDNLVHDRFEEKLVEPVDAADCGWGTREGTRPELSLSACISSFNPDPGASPTKRDSCFMQAVLWVKPVVVNLFNEAEAFVAARAEVLDAQTADAGRVLILEKFAPWADHIFDRDGQDRLLYVVHPSERGGWQIQQVPVKPGSFEGRKPLPKEWAGLRDAELAAVTGVPDAVFCHPGRFCGGAASRIGTLDLAARAVEA